MTLVFVSWSGVCRFQRQPTPVRSSFTTNALEVAALASTSSKVNGVRARGFIALLHLTKHRGKGDGKVFGAAQDLNTFLALKGRAGFPVPADLANEACAPHRPLLLNGVWSATLLIYKVLAPHLEPGGIVTLRTALGLG
jgi:hypothetical protein